MALQYSPNWPKSGAYDESAATELKLYIDNTSELMGPRSQGEAIRQSLLRKIKKGTFDLELSAKAWEHLVDAGAKMYAKEFAVSSDWPQIFSVATRKAVAKEMAEEFYAEAKGGGYNENRSPRPTSGYAYETTSHWQESSDEDWETVMYTPTGDEKYVGVRSIDDSKMNVFKSGNRYIAQLSHMTRNAYDYHRPFGGDRPPKPKFELGDQVRDIDTGATGKVSFIGQYDSLIGGWRYRVLEPDGTRKYWNETRMELVGGEGMSRNHKGLLRRNADLPRPRPRVDTSLSRVARIEEQHRSREKYFDPEKRYPRGTKSHHFAINPTDPRDVPHHLRAVRINPYKSFEYTKAPDENGNQVTYDTFDNGNAPEGEPQWYEVEYAGGSDYSGGSVHQSNFKVLREMLDEAHPDGEKPAVWVEAYGGYGTYALFVVYDALADEIKETLGALEDYPVIDEEAMSELETEQEDEAWDNMYRRDFEKAVMKGVNAEYPDFDEIDDWPMDDDQTLALFHMAREVANEYWEHGSEGPYIRIEKVADAAVDLITGAKKEPSWSSVDQHDMLEEVRKGFELQLDLPGVE
jgi:hypothetical protein